MEFTEEVLKAAKNVHMSKNRGRECGLEHQAEQRVGGTFSLQRGRRQGSRTREGKKKEKLGLLWEIGLWFRIRKRLCVMSVKGRIW